MTDIVNLANRRPPVHYTVRITHHWNDTIEVFVEDVSDDDRSRESVASAIGRAALQLGSFPEADAMHKALLSRIYVLMNAEANTPEGDELAFLADIVQAYESTRWPGRRDSAA